MNFADRNFINTGYYFVLWSVSVSHIKDKTQIAKVAMFQREKVANN